jgi:monoamine oxidase
MSDRQLSRRSWLSGVTASAAATVLSTNSGAAEAATTVSASGSFDTDVVVIGGGYSGLACARAIAATGRQVLVLEARNRVGGRCVNSKLPGAYSAYTVEAGAEFLGPTQTRMYELAKEFGIQTYRTYNTGRTVNYTGGTRSTYTGVIPLANLVAASEGAIALLRLDAMAKQVPAEAPWQAAKAVEWDSQTFQTWMDRNLLTPNGKDLLRLANRAKCRCCSCSTTSALAGACRPCWPPMAAVSKTAWWAARSASRWPWARLWVTAACSALRSRTSNRTRTAFSCRVATSLCAPSTR